MLSGNWLAEGTHLNVIGSNFLGKAEVDAVAVRRCESIIVDSKDQARLEAGDFVQALEEGSIHWADVHELGQVIVGRYTGRGPPPGRHPVQIAGHRPRRHRRRRQSLCPSNRRSAGKTVDW